MTIQQAKIYGKNELTSSPSPELDVAVLLQHITGFDKTHLLLNRDYELTAEQDFRLPTSPVTRTVSGWIFTLRTMF